MSEITLKSAQFRREREKRWRELENLVSRVERSGLRTLNARELHRLPILYRGVISSLSVARSISLDRNLTQYLEALASRSYFVVYSPRRRANEVVRQFFRHSFSQAVRDLRWWVALSFALLMVGFLAAFNTLGNHVHLELSRQPGEPLQPRQ